MGHQHRHAAPAVAAPASPTATHGPPAADTSMGFMNAGERALPTGETAYGAAPRAEMGVFGSMLQYLDRAMAQAELSSQFDVVDDNFMGPRMPNQVTRAEFERIATMYSDIRTGQTNIQFAQNGTAEEQQAFRGAAMGDIGNILTTNQGRELLDQLAYGKVGGRNETVTLGGVSNPAQAAMDLAPGENAADMFNGTGVSTVVNYAAGQTVDMGALHQDYQTAGYRQTSSDTALFHELTHALHYRNGAVSGGMIDGGSVFDLIDDEQAVIPNDYDTRLEEYQTVGLAAGSAFNENQYRRERALATGTTVAQRDNYNGPGPATP